MQLPVGLSNFRALIDYKDARGQPYLFVDKSLFIKDIIDNGSAVILITRPRRFGKTLNLSMLRHFFASEISEQSTAHLFQNLKISDYADYMVYQGKTPVIFLTFKDIKSKHFLDSYEDIKNVMRDAYRDHERKVKASENLTSSEQADFQRILDREASDAEMRQSLKTLTFCLNQVYGEKPIILIDEYDTPIQTAYLENYYEEMIAFMRAFFSVGFKDNDYLKRAILTGILRVSKESLFSGLNNVKVYTMLDTQYQEHFGFTELETRQLLEKTSLGNTLKEVSNWYNGYQIGKTVLYNPWSIVNYIQDQGRFRPYWVNTGDNHLIKKLLVGSDVYFKTELETLLRGSLIEKLVDVNIVFEKNLEKNAAAAWTILLMAGYLKVMDVRETMLGPVCQLKIPNNEVMGLYQGLISKWLSGAEDSMRFNQFLNDMLNGRMEYFEESLKEILLQVFSVHDVKGKNPEKFYHGFLLGVISGIDKTCYVIDSNKEAGKGRFDIIIAPKDKNQIGIIMEIKSIEKKSSTALLKAAGQALEQIEQKQYKMNGLFQELKHALKIGIAFCGKEVAVVYHKEGV